MNRYFMIYNQNRINKYKNILINNKRTTKDMGHPLMTQNQYRHDIKIKKK